MRYIAQPGVCCGCGQRVPDVPRHMVTCVALDEALGEIVGLVPGRYENPAFRVSLRCPCGAAIEAVSRNKRYCKACLARRVADRMQRAYAARKGGSVRKMRRWRYGGAQAAP
jgi:hypothetical protein